MRYQIEVTPEEWLAKHGWRRDRDGLWYELRDPSVQYTFDAARSKVLHEELRK